MTFNVNLLLCFQYYAHCDQTAEDRITQCSLKVALYNSYSHIKFDTLRISGIISDYLSSVVCNASALRQNNCAVFTAKKITVV